MTDPFERAVLREELESSAHELRSARDGFFIHAAVYVAVNLLLFVIWVVTDRDHPWFVYPLLGWGIGLAAHGAAVRVAVSRQRALAARLGGNT
jgi:hypothetical protein